MLDFSDNSFSDFFACELNVNINDPEYATNGGSKGKRLRSFLQVCDDVTAVRALRALWEYRQECLTSIEEDDPVRDADTRFQSLVRRLSGDAPSYRATENRPYTAVGHATMAEIKTQLLQLSNLQPHARGYAFEVFLKSLFDAFSLAAREPFRLRGEQIDGSFHFDGATYLLEAKWYGQPIGVAELHTFHGKIEQKAAWTRGLVVSNSGFTEEGLNAFGRGKKVVCMDGLDLFDMLDREIPLTEVLERKIRRAAETGAPFMRVRDLFHQ